jgi:hypothetical protein
MACRATAVRGVIISPIAFLPRRRDATDLGARSGRAATGSSLAADDDGPVALANAVRRGASAANAISPH